MSPVLKGVEMSSVVVERSDGCAGVWLEAASGSASVKRRVRALTAAAEITGYRTDLCREGGNERV